MKKLLLTKESVRVLLASELAQVHGGHGKVSSVLAPQDRKVSSVKPGGRPLSSVKPGGRPLSSVRPGGGKLSSVFKPTATAARQR